VETALDEPPLQALPPPSSSRPPEKKTPGVTGRLVKAGGRRAYSRKTAPAPSLIPGNMLLQFYPTNVKGSNVEGRQLSAVDHQPGWPLDISCHPPTIEPMKVGPADRRPALTEME